MAYTPIDKSSDYFNTKLYTGNGGTNAQTGVGFQPDWCWFKDRSASRNHAEVDAVRGRSKVVFPDLTNAEETSGSTKDLVSFDSDGFTLGATQISGSFNFNGSSIVSWNWKAGTSFTNDASATGIGSIDSTGSFNNDSGFSIVSYTGTGTAGSIKHGMNIAPKMVIVKSISGTGEWITWHTGINIQAKLSLNTTDAVYNPGSGIYWNSTLPTSSVFSVGTSGSLNGNGVTYIAYCFADVQGYSKFGSYTGNGSTDGTFVYTGFKPAFTLIKRTDSATGGSWILFDNKRGTNVINPVDVVLAASNNQSEADWGTTYDCDYLSNGFKWRFNGTGGYNNASGATYIYMAFAENPFVTSTAIPACAR